MSKHSYGKAGNAALRQRWAARQSKQAQAASVADAAQGLTHLSLFTGIGGLDLAAEWAGFTTARQCEWVEYPTKILEKHWPNVPRWRDIHDLSANNFRERTGITNLTCLSGGVPCQPHSVAGKREASSDARDLWPEMWRVIGEIRPKWVVAENVRGLLSSENGRFFLGVLRDFAQMGYDVGWGITSAAATGAIHRRERVAIIAHANGHRRKRRVGKLQKEKRATWRAAQFQNCENYLSEPCISGKHDGFSSAMDRIRALGNAVVPQQFYPVFAAIAEIEAAQHDFER